MMMMDHYYLLSIKRINTATLYHAHVLKTTHIIITKQCGGTPVSFAVVLLNLEHKQETLEIMFFVLRSIPIGPYCHFYNCQ